jgi:arylformamidase
MTDAAQAQPRRIAPYDIEATVPDFRDYLARYTEASARTRTTWPSRLDASYGSGPAERLDIFLAETPRAPVVVFLHGGGWRGSSKEDRAFPAETFCPAGAVWISQEYPLAPAASLDAIVEAVRNGLAWVFRNAATFGGDPDRLFVCGNSAGAHLAAMALVTDWGARSGQPADLVKGATLISGVFDMTPLMQTAANGWLKLDRAAAVRNSPIFSRPAADVPLICAVGTDEPPEFVEQSRSFAAAWQGHGRPVHYMPVAGHHHFSIIGELGRRDGALVPAMLAQIGLG